MENVPFAIVGAVAATMLGVPATDPPQYGSAPRARTQLTLSYRAEAGFAAAVKLACEPAGGGHPAAAQACATLARTGADPSRVTPGTHACILLYAPVTAELTGTWRGRPVAWAKRYGNTCEMRRATGVLFRF